MWILHIYIYIYIHVHSMYVYIYICKFYVCIYIYTYMYINNVTGSTRTRRGGSWSCLRFDDKTFFIYRTCMHRAPCVRALCELVVLLLPENVTGVRPRWHATSSEHVLHTSHCTLHTLHFTLHTCTSHSTVHLISNHLFFFAPHVTSSDLFPIPSHMSSKQVLLNCFHLIRALKKVHLNSSQLFCTPESSYC